MVRNKRLYQDMIWLVRSQLRKLNSSGRMGENTSITRNSTTTFNSQPTILYTYILSNCQTWQFHVFKISMTENPYTSSFSLSDGCEHCYVSARRLQCIMRISPSTKRSDIPPPNMLKDRGIDTLYFIKIYSRKCGLYPSGRYKINPIITV